MPDSYRVAVVGGGVTGLCAAYYLARSLGSEEVVLLERSRLMGGQTQTSRSGGFVNDWGPNGFLDREPLTLAWIDDLGLSDSLVRSRDEAAHRFILRDGVLKEIPLSPPRFLTSNLLSLRGRLRVLCEPLVRSRTNEDESLWQFAARRIGKEAADYLIDPMASGIFGGDAKSLCLGAVFPRMAEMEREHGSLFRAMLAKRKTRSSAGPAGPAGRLTSFAEGIGHLPEQAALRAQFKIKTGAEVGRITRTAGHFELAMKSGTPILCRSLVLALPAYAAASLVQEFDSTLASDLGAIPYASMTVICAGYRRERVGHTLSGFGFLVPKREGRRMLGCIWSSSVFDHRAPEGWVQLRTMVGGASDPEALRLTDEELVQLFRKDAGDVLEIDSDPESLEIFRWPLAIPQYTTGHPARCAAVERAEARHPGLVLAGNAYRGVGLNDCVVSAHRAVARVLKEPV